MSSLGERLASLRKQRGLTQQSVVDDKGVGISSAQVLSNYENGNREPDLETLCRLSKFYNVSTDYLLGQTEEENPQISDFIEKTNLPRALSNFLLFVRMNTFDEGKTYDAICELLSSHEFVKSLQTICQICVTYTPVIHEEYPAGLDGCKLHNFAGKLREEVSGKTNNLYTVCRIDDIYDGKIYRAQQYYSKAIENLICNMMKE